MSGLWISAIIRVSGKGPGSSGKFGKGRQSTPGERLNRSPGVAFRPRPFVGASPGVHCRRAMSCLGKHRLHHRLGFPWPVWHHAIAQRAVVAAQVDRSIQTLVDHHRLGFEAILDQVDLAVVLDRGIGSAEPAESQQRDSIVRSAFCFVGLAVRASCASCRLVVETEGTKARAEKVGK